MAATQKQVEANRNNAKHSTGPRTPQGKARAALNAWRHGLTGQVATLPEEDRQAFEKFTTEIRHAYHPEGPLEKQIAQSIAEDEWRLNRARAIENNIIALGHSSTAAEVATDNTQIHAAMTQARVFWRNPEKFALLTLYEQRIGRRIQRAEERLRALQSERKAALEQALEEARLLDDLARSKGETSDPARDFPNLNGFAFSTVEITRLLDRRRRLADARRQQRAGLIPETPPSRTGAACRQADLSCRS
ncbi:MAG: hypothetical protein ABUS51_08335 [Acidobacteriota bacterium]